MNVALYAKSSPSAPKRYLSPQTRMRTNTYTPRLAEQEATDTRHVKMLHWRVVHLCMKGYARAHEKTSMYAHQAYAHIFRQNPITMPKERHELFGGIRASFIVANRPNKPVHNGEGWHYCKARFILYTTYSRNARAPHISVHTCTISHTRFHHHSRHQ